MSKWIAVAFFLAAFAFGWALVDWVRSGPDLRRCAFCDQEVPW